MVLECAVVAPIVFFECEEDCKVGDKYRNHLEMCVQVLKPTHFARKLSYISLEEMMKCD